MLTHFFFLILGKLGHAGSVIGFERNLQPICNVLPRLPKELPVLILEDPSQPRYSFKIRHEPVRTWLTYLKNHNEAYKDIEISEENLETYRNFSTQGIPIEEFQTQTFQQQQFFKVDDEIMHEADAVLETDLDGDLPPASTTVPTFITNQTNDTLTKEAIELAGREDMELKFNKPKNSEKPVSEFTEFYFTRAFPHLFPTTDGDIRQVLPGPKPSFKSWINHLYRYKDSRFKEDPIFVMTVSNQQKRHACLSLGSVVANDPKIKDMTWRELKEKIEKNDPEILPKLRYYSKTIDGSDQYFYELNTKCQALQEHLRIRSNDSEMFNIFQTFSFADMHWEGFHELIPESVEYLNKIIVESEDQIPPDREAEYITKKQDFLLRAAAVNKHAGLAVDYFCERVETFLEEVAKPILGLKDFIIRYELQERGAIHAHCLLNFQKGIGPSDMKAALQALITADPIFDLEEKIQKLEDCLAKEVPAEQPAANDPDQEEEPHPLDELSKLQDQADLARKALRARAFLEEFTARDMGISCMHPSLQPSTWPEPYGNVASKPLINPTRLSLEKIMENDQELRENYTRLVNMCQLHRCLHRYCLNEIGKAKLEKKGLKTPEALAKQQLRVDKNEKGEDAFYQCRFGYPMELYGYDATYMSTTDPGCQTITAVNKKPNMMLRGAHVERSKENKKIHEVYFPRNHPTVNFHVKEILLIWRANTDTKPIYDTEQVRKYLFKYVCKSEKESTAFKKAVVAAVANSDDKTTVKSGLQKLFIKGVNKDVSLQECHLHLNKNRHHAEISLPTHHCSLAEGKALNLNPGDLATKVTRSSGYQDIYWNRENDPNYHEACAQYDAFKNEGKEEEYFKRFHKDWFPPCSPRETSLHEFVSFYDKQWRPSGQQTLPIFSPSFQKVPNLEQTERFEKWARAKLLQAKPGSTPQNILDGFDSITDAFKNFIETNTKEKWNLIREGYKAAAVPSEDVEGDGDQVTKDEDPNKDPGEFEDLYIGPVGK